MLLKFDNFELKLNLYNSQTVHKLAKLSLFKANKSLGRKKIYYTAHTKLGIENDK
jgi:hypothetical protein